MKSFESICQPNQFDQPKENANITEIPLLINEFMTNDTKIHEQIIERLVAIAMHDEENELLSNELFINPLVVMLKSIVEKKSQAASNALSIVIKSSPKIRESLVKIGFIESARFILTNEKTPVHVYINMLDVILALIFNSLYACEMNNLVPVLQHLVEDKDEEKKEIATKAKMICAILVSQGISGQSSSSEVLELQMHIQEYKRENEESKRKVEEFERNDDVQKRKIIELEHQLEESKQKASEISISITVPSGSYTKKEGEFTYISTFDEYKTFTILPIITQGIFKLELKINVIQWLWYGLVKSGLVIPLLTHPFKFNNNMFFFNSGIVYQNSSRYNGNQEMKNGDIVTIELNMALPRTAHLFINNVQQPVYMSGIPDSFTLQNKNDSVTVLSLKNLTVPSTANLPNATEMKWE